MRFEGAGADELRGTFTSTTGGVMTEEVGAITGELELLTRPTTDGGVEARVRYAGADEWYVVVGSPWRTPGRAAADHRSAHERILERLTTPGPVESGNERPVGLT